MENAEIAEESGSTPHKQMYIAITRHNIALFQWQTDMSFMTVCVMRLATSAATVKPELSSPDLFLEWFPV